MKPHYAIFHLVTFTPAWLALSRQRRREIADGVVALLSTTHGAVSVRWFDAEAFSAKTTDVLLVETEDLFEYYRFWERVRDTSLFTEPYMVENQVVVGIEQGHRVHEELGAA